MIHLEVKTCLEKSFTASRNTWFAFLFLLTRRIPPDLGFRRLLKKKNCLWAITSTTWNTKCIFFQKCLELYAAGDLACYVTSLGIEDLLEVWSLYNSQVVPSCAEPKLEILLGGEVLIFTLFLWVLWYINLVV